MPDLDSSHHKDNYIARTILPNFNLIIVNRLMESNYWVVICYFNNLKSHLGHEEHRTRPADILVPNWVLGRPGARDLSPSHFRKTHLFCHTRV